MAKKPNGHYINQDEFHEHLCEYLVERQRCIDEGLPIPRVTEKIGEFFLLLARNMAKKNCFANYIFKEDFISDAVSNCLKGIHNYNMEMGHPYTYFSKVIKYAFFTRISNEKKYLYQKYVIIDSSDAIIEDYQTQCYIARKQYIDEYEKKKAEKKALKAAEKPKEESSCEPDENMIDFDDDWLDSIVNEIENDIGE